MKLLLGVTGSVAATLAPQLLEKLRVVAEVRALVTKRVELFWQPNPDAQEVLTDEDDSRPYTRGDPVLHIDLRNWADVYLIAPVTANTLGKLAHGLADNLVTNVARAWPVTKPLILAPAMNTYMWNHPATEEQIVTLRRWFKQSLDIVPPVSKRLACGEEGMGAMASVDDIVTAVRRCSAQ